MTTRFPLPGHVLHDVDTHYLEILHGFVCRFSDSGPGVLVACDS